VFWATDRLTAVPLASSCPVVGVEVLVVGRRGKTPVGLPHTAPRGHCLGLTLLETNPPFAGASVYHIYGIPSFAAWALKGVRPLLPAACCIDVGRAY